LRQLWHRPKGPVGALISVKNYINPHLGGVLLAKLVAVQIQGLQAVMERAGKSADMRRLVHIVLHRALDQAVQWELVPRNVCKAVKKPRIVKKTMRVLDGAEVERLLVAAKGSRYYALFLMAVTTGMRRGELLALQWEDVDLKRGTVSVRHTLVKVDGKPVLGEPKTQASRRSVVLPAVAVAALWEHRKAMMAEGHPGPWVFCNRLGKPIHASEVRARQFKRLLQKAGLPTTIRFHDLRHTAATLLLAEGISPKVIQERLGHSNIGITLGTYAHCLPSMQQEAADRLDTFFERKGEALG
jgi:integrase